MQLENILEIENKIESFLTTYFAHKEYPVFLYGAGNALMYFIKLFGKYDIPITAIIDRRAEWGQERYLQGIPFKSLEDICSETTKAFVVISAPAYRKEITECLQKEAPDFYVISFEPALEVLQNVNSKTRKEYYKKNKERFIMLYGMLADEMSKVTFEQVIRGALTSDCDCYNNIASSSQYFPDIVCKKLKGEQETFVDLGAFTGDTIKEFIEVMDNRYRKIYAFEPDESNIAVAKKSLSDERIHIIRKGVGGENRKVYFRNECAGTDEGAHIVSNSSVATDEIEIVRLDDYLNDEITFLKMDIEGMELDAIRGGEKLIRQYKPKLAVSVYHRLEDILEIPEYIWAMHLDYKLYLRHYWNCCGTDTILFAL